MLYHLLLLDADDTILDFKKTEEAAFFASFADFSDIVLSHETFLTYQKINKELWCLFEQGKISKSVVVIERFRRLFVQMNVDLCAEQFEKRYQENLAQGAFVIEGAKELLELLKGKVRMAIVSNGVANTQRRRLAAAGLVQYFEQIIISEDAGFQKPHSGFFAYALEKLHNPPVASILMIGDSLSADIKGGIAAGIDTCWYNPENVLPPKEMKITYTIKNLQQILQIIGGNYEQGAID